MDRVVEKCLSPDTDVIPLTYFTLSLLLLYLLYLLLHRTTLNYVIKSGT